FDAMRASRVQHVAHGAAALAVELEVLPQVVHERLDFLRRVEATQHGEFFSRQAEVGGPGEAFAHGVALYHMAMDANDEKIQPHERTEAIAERLAFKSRFVLVFGAIDHAAAPVACTRLIALAGETDAPINMLL